MFYLVKIKTSIDILGSEKCKVIFGFKYNIRPTFPSKADKNSRTTPRYEYL